MATRVRMISKGIEAMLKGSEGRSAVEPKVEETYDRAVGGAPVASGEYRDGIEIQWDTTDRVVGRVVATAPHSMVVEANTGNLVRSL